jgi:hypothetical protein
MQPREWSPPPIEPSRDKAAARAGASARSPRSHRGVLEYFVSFVFHMLFFGAIAGLVHSRFAIDLGLFFFFTNDGMIEWALRKVGIRLVADSIGATFVTGFVWVTCASILFVRWKDQAPAWLSLRLPPTMSWSDIAAAALACAVLKLVSTAAARREVDFATMHPVAHDPVCSGAI